MNGQVFYSAKAAIQAALDTVQGKKAWDLWISSDSFIDLAGKVYNAPRFFRQRRHFDGTQARAIG